MSGSRSGMYTLMLDIVTSAMKKDHAVLLLNMMNVFQRQVKKNHSLRFILPLRMLPLWGWFRVYLGLV